MINVVLIPDGNRRGAKKLGLRLAEVYRLAAKKVDMAMQFFLSQEDVDVFVVYGLSFDNIKKRSVDKLKPIYEVQEEQYKKWIKDAFLSKHKVKVKVAGEWKNLQRTESFPSGLPDSYLDAVRELEEVTSKNEGKLFFILIGYSGRKEITKSFEKIVSSGVKIANPHLLNVLEVPHEIDIVIRTAGERRLSDVLPYQSAYAELSFIDKDFPEIEEYDLKSVLEDFKKRKRNFGR